MAASFVDQPQSAVMLKQAENGSGQITLDTCYVAMTLLLVRESLWFGIQYPIVLISGACNFEQSCDA